MFVFTNNITLKLLDLFDLPRTASLGFVTGCQMANCTALAAARNAVLHRVGYDVETQGLRNAPPINIVISAEAHITIHASLKILGFGTAGSHEVETDEQGRMRSDALRRTLEPLKGSSLFRLTEGSSTEPIIALDASSTEPRFVLTPPNTEQ